MKKILMFLGVFAAIFFGINAVSAEEIDLNNIDTNTYIIGERVYELNEYVLSIYDIVNATAEYANKYGEVAPIYYVGQTSSGKYVIVTTGANSSVKKDVEEVFPEGKVEVSTINNEVVDEGMANMTKSHIQMLVDGAVYELSNTANDYGFNYINYNWDTNVVTFDIADITRKLADFKASGIVDLFTMNVEAVDSITYQLGDVTKTVKYKDMDTSSEVIALAKELLAYMAGGADALNYGAVAGKEMTATVSFSEFGLTYTDTYTIKFTFDMNAFLMEEENKIQGAVIALNNEIFDNLDPETNSAWGLYGVNILEDKVTFMVADLDAKLADYKESKIVELFINNSKNASKITYSVGDWNKTVNLPEDADTTTEVVALAKELLAHMATGNTLDFRSVANKPVTATIYYEVGVYKEELSYTLDFYYDLNNILYEHEYAISTAVDKLNQESILTDVGFYSVGYNDNTITYYINKLDGKLADYKESKIVDLFLANVKGATSITYSVGSWSKTVNLPEDADTTTEVVALAKELLAHMAVGYDALTLKSVANRSVTATVNYVLGNQTDSVDYTLSFVYDMDGHVGIQDVAIYNGVMELNLENSGFGSVYYDFDNEGKRDVVFTIQDGTVKLANFKNSGIVDLFLKNIEGATKVVYQLAEEKTVNLPKDADTTTEVIALAKEILIYLASDSESGSLDLDSVAGDSISATVTYDVNGESRDVTYTIKFTK